MLKKIRSNVIHTFYVMIIFIFSSILMPTVFMGIKLFNAAQSSNPAPYHNDNEKGWSVIIDTVAYDMALISERIFF